MRIRTDFLRRMVRELKLPYCHLGSTPGWPFFLPMVVKEDNTTKYLPEDYAFCRRCCDMDEPPYADMTVYPMHLGDYAYGLEEGKASTSSVASTTRSTFSGPHASRSSLPNSERIDLCLRPSETS